MTSEKRRRSENCFREILQVFSVTIHSKDELVSEQPLKLRIGDNSTAADLSLSSDLLLSSTSTEKKKKKKKTLKVYGTVKIVECGVSDIILYNRDKQNPELITSGDTISLFAPTYHCPMCLGSDLLIDLHEADQDLEISRGYLYFEYHLPNFETYYDNRFSSVIHGQHGSATLFYTLFYNAAAATVKANLVITNISTTTPACVYGCLSVGYAGHDYASDFLKHHYRPLLFKRSPTDAISLNRGAALLLPLDIPMVGVPKGSSLIIEADLHVVCGESEIATLGAQPDFPLPDYLGSPPHSQTVEGSNCSLQVTVTWWG